MFVNWHKLFQCHDENTCENSISHYIVTSPFSFHSVIYSLLMVVYLILFSLFWMYNILQSFQTIINSFEVEEFYRKRLQLSIEDLYVATWDEIMFRLLQLHHHGIYRIPIKDKLTQHDIVLRIMRKENYLIALINQDLLNLRLPWWSKSFVSEKLFLTKSLEWSLQYCIFDHMFTEQYTISLDFLRNQKDLESRFYFVGIVHAIMLPFMLLFMVIHFIFQNLQHFHSNKSYLGPRQFSPLALWKLREFNELPHIFELRLQKAYIPATNYLGLPCFINPYLIILARFASYISGSFIAVLIVISLMNENVMLYVHLYDHNLLWFLGIFTAIFAGSRSTIPDDSKQNNFHTPDELLEIISSHTHYMPSHWVDKGSTKVVVEEFRELFPYKLQIFLIELLSVILTPLVLCFSLPKSARNIITFVR